MFNDTFMNFNYPEIGKAATRILEAAGYEVRLADPVCCGRPMISKGFAESARINAAENAHEFGHWIEKGYSVVGCEPSCVLTFRDEYPALIGAEAEPLAGASFLFEEFVERETLAGRWNLSLRQTGLEALVHTHCHQKALVGSRSLVGVLAESFTTTEIDSGCCGMAGSFGYEKEHYAVSTALAARTLLPTIEAAPDAVVVTSGVSCRQQIVDLSGRRVLHPAEALELAMDGNAGKEPGRV